MLAWSSVRDGIRVAELRSGSSIYAASGGRERLLAVPGKIFRQDEVDHGIATSGGETTPLDLRPRLAVDRSDVGGVVLAVAAIVVRHPAYERVEGQRGPLAPGQRDRSGQPGMVGLREHDRAAV